MSDPLTDWLLDEGCRCASTGDLVENFCKLLRQAGVPVERIFLGTIIPHPQAAGIAVIYDVSSDERREIEVDHQRFELLRATKARGESDEESRSTL